MLLTILFGVFFQPAWAGDCPQLNIPIEGVHRVAFTPRTEPRLMRLSYQIEFCHLSDLVYLVHTDVATGEVQPRQFAFQGKLEKIYRPRNVDAEVFRDLPKRIQVLPSDNYEMLGSNKANTIGELRFYLKHRLHTLSAQRISLDEERQSEATMNSGAQLMPRAKTSYAPFTALHASTYCPDPDIVTMVRSPNFAIYGLYYSLWTLRTRNGYESTELVETGTGVSVQLVQAYTADINGQFLIRMPELDGDYLAIPDIERELYIPQLKQEMMVPPLSKEEWMELNNIVISESEFSAFFAGYAESEAAQRIRRIFSVRIPSAVVLHEWIELLTSPELRELWKDKRLAHRYAVVLVRDILRREFPRLTELARQNANVGSSMQAFAEGVGTLFIGGMMTEPQLRELLERNPGENACMRLLSRFGGRAVRRGLPADLKVAMRKASLNFDILRNSLKK